MPDLTNALGEDVDASRLCDPLPVRLSRWSRGCRCDGYAS